MYKCKYFLIQELVSKQLYEKYGERCWQFFNTKILIVIDRLREYFGKPITINNWLWGGDFQQRGLRCNLDEIALKKTANGEIYVSQHIFGNALDFDVKGLSANDVRNEILDNQNLFPEIKRMEKDVNWVHIDSANIACDEIYLFKP